MQPEIDFTNCERLTGKAYNGANGKKIGIAYQNEAYMLKFPPSAEGKQTELSYTNSCLSEHIASSIFNILGIPAHQTMLGLFVLDGKEKIVCACKDFTAGGKKLLDFCSIKNTVIDSESSSNGMGTELIDILDTVEKQTFVNPDALREHFWNMFVADALLGNFDRHNGNWGFLYDPKNEKTEVAPVYDCGSCLLPQADETIMNQVLINESELDARIYHFPTSAIKENNKKIGYYDFLMAGEYEDCNRAIARIAPRIDIEKIHAFIDEVPYLTGLQREFYKTYVLARHEKIIRPALEHIMEQKLSGSELSL